MEVGGQRHAPAALPPGMPRYIFYRRLGKPQGRSEFIFTTLNSCGNRGLRICHNIRRVRIPLPFEGTWALLCTDLNTPISTIDHRVKETCVIMCFANTATFVSETKRLKKCVVKVFRHFFNKKSHYGQFLRELFRPSYRYDYQRNDTENRRTLI